jgi:hypothetical protein
MAEENIKDRGESVGNGKCGIRPGQVFKDEASWRILREGCEIVVYLVNGCAAAYNDSWNYEHPYRNDNLRINLAVAKRYYGEAAFLVRREGGKLVCNNATGRKYIQSLKKISVVSSWKQNRWHNFGQVGEIAARRG